MIRYYDYSIFGLSASILAKHFMPGNQNSDKTLAFYAIFSLATIAKPLGSLIFGAIGDKMGRVYSVRISMIIAATSTCFVAFTPSFNQIGYFSVILITLLRMTFLMSLAGETDAIKIYVAEMIGKNNRNLVVGVVSFSAQIGVLIASIAYHIANCYDEIEWLWKANFVIGGFLGFIAISMRELFLETPAFLNSKLLKDNVVNQSTDEIIINNKVKFLLATIISGSLGGVYNFLIIFLASFAANIANIIDYKTAAMANILFIIIYGLSCIVSGYLADKLKKNSQVIIALLLSIICIMFMRYSNYSLMLHLLLVALVPFYSIPSYILVQSLFHINIRMRMYGLSHSIGSMILSSTTPFICMSIWQSTENVSLVLGYFLFQLALLFFALLYMIKKDYNNMFETIN